MFRNIIYILKTQHCVSLSCLGVKEGADLSFVPGGVNWLTGIVLWRLRIQFIKERLYRKHNKSLVSFKSLCFRVTYIASKEMSSNDTGIKLFS